MVMTIEQGLLLVVEVSPIAVVFDDQCEIMSNPWRSLLAAAGQVVQFDINPKLCCHSNAEHLFRDDIVAVCY